MKLYLTVKICMISLKGILNNVCTCVTSMLRLINMKIILKSLKLLTISSNFILIFSFNSEIKFLKNKIKDLKYVENMFHWDKSNYNTIPLKIFLLISTKISLFLKILEFTLQEIQWILMKFQMDQFFTFWVFWFWL